MSRYSAVVRTIVDSYASDLLPGWEIELLERLPDIAPDDEPAARISWKEHQFRARIWISDETLGGPTDELRRTILHELLHPLFRELEMDFRPEYHEDPKGCDRWEHLEELIVERIALALA